MKRHFLTPWCGCVREWACQPVEVSAFSYCAATSSSEPRLISTLPNMGRPPPPPVSVGGSGFLRVASGKLAGLYIAAAYVTVDAPPPAPPIVDPAVAVNAALDTVAAAIAAARPAGT